MKHAFLLGAALAAFMPTVVTAQRSPYAGQESREIKALSAEETKQYPPGAGMRYAQPAELNRYRGPLHVLAIVKVREGLARDDYKDPGWYMHPQGTVAHEWTSATPVASRAHPPPSLTSKSPSGRAA
jgi:hypothetical protein